MKNGDELEIEIGPTGEVRVITHGVKGKRCLEYLEIFEQLLGQVEEKQTTPEFNQIETQVDGQTHTQSHVRRS